MEDKKKKIDLLKAIFADDQLRYSFLVELISSDVLINVDECNKSREMLDFIHDNISSITDDQNIRNETIKFVISGYDIIHKEIQRLNDAETNA